MKKIGRLEIKMNFNICYIAYSPRKKSRIGIYYFFNGIKYFVLKRCNNSKMFF